jgi:hypothetical protein
MKLYQIQYTVTFGKGPSALCFPDTIVVPANTEAEAKSSFIGTVERVGTLLMKFNDTRLMAPIRDLGGSLAIIGCSKL